VNIRELDKLSTTKGPENKKPEERKISGTATSPVPSLTSPSREDALKKHGNVTLFHKILASNKKKTPTAAGHQDHQQEKTSESSTVPPATLLGRSLHNFKKKSLLDPNMKEKLQEIQKNNRMRIVEAHLFTTIVNQSTPMVVANPVSLRSKFQKATALMSPTSASASSSVAGNTVPASEVADQGTATDKVTGEEKSPEQPAVKEEQPQQQQAPPQTPQATPVDDRANVLAALQNGTLTIPVISDTVNQYIVATTVASSQQSSAPAAKRLYEKPADLPSFQWNLKMMQRNRHLITKEIRLRKLARRKIWEELSDAYLCIRNKWENHILQVEKQEDHLAYREGPKLRGSAPSASSMRPTQANILASGGGGGGGLGSSLGGGANAFGLPGANNNSSANNFGRGVSAMRGSSSAAAPNNTNNSNDPNAPDNGAFAATRSQATNYLGMNVARSDYEQEKILNEINARELKQRRIELGRCDVPDMISPWCGHADPVKLPRIPKWPEELRQFEVMYSSSSSSESESSSGSEVESSDNESAINEPENEENEQEEGGGGANRSRKRLAVSSPTRSNHRSAKRRKKLSKEERKKDKKNKKQKVPKVFREYSFNAETFPKFKNDPKLIDFIDTSSLRLTTDGKKQMCSALPLPVPCPVDCNCALQVERYSSFTNIWTDLEKAIFVDKFLQYPKNFHKIASFLANRTTKDCIKFYYDSKSTIEFKSLLKEFDNRRRQTGKLNWNYSIKASHMVGSSLYPSAAGLVPLESRNNNNNSMTSVAESSRKDCLIEVPSNDLTYTTFTLQPPHTGKTLNLPVSNLFHKQNLENEEGRILILQNYPKDSTVRQALRKRMNDFLLEEEERAAQQQQEAEEDNRKKQLAAKKKASQQAAAAAAAAQTALATNNDDNESNEGTEGKKTPSRRGRGRRPNKEGGEGNEDEEMNFDDNEDIQPLSLPVPVVVPSVIPPSMLSSLPSSDSLIDHNNLLTNTTTNNSNYHYDEMINEITRHYTEEEYTLSDCKIEELLFDYEEHVPGYIGNQQHTQKPILKEPFNKKFLYYSNKKFYDYLYSTYRYTGGQLTRAFYNQMNFGITGGYKENQASAYGQSGGGGGGLPQQSAAAYHHQQQQQLQQQQQQAGLTKHAKHSMSTSALQNMSGSDHPHHNQQQQSAQYQQQIAAMKGGKAGGGVRKTNSSNTLVEMMSHSSHPSTTHSNPNHPNNPTANDQQAQVLALRATMMAGRGGGPAVASGGGGRGSGRGRGRGGGGGGRGAAGLATAVAVASTGGANNKTSGGTTGTTSSGMTVGERMMATQQRSSSSTSSSVAAAPTTTVVKSEPKIVKEEKPALPQSTAVVQPKKETERKAEEERGKGGMTVKEDKVDQEGSTKQEEQDEEEEEEEETEGVTPSETAPTEAATMEEDEEAEEDNDNDDHSLETEEERIAHQVIAREEEEQEEEKEKDNEMMEMDREQEEEDNEPDTPHSPPPSPTTIGDDKDLMEEETDLMEIESNFTGFTNEQPPPPPPPSPPLSV
jgi:hypothetical protein